MWNTYNEYEGYRYGYNGQDKVSQSFGEGAHTTAQFWEYDTRLARRWNADPIRKPWESPYSTFGNNPIWKNDVLGNTESVHTDNKGGVIANKDDGDNRVYEHKAGTTKSDIDKKYTKDDHSAGGRWIGELGGANSVRVTLALANDNGVVLDSLLYNVPGPVLTQTILAWNNFNGYDSYRYGFNGQDKMAQCFGEGSHTTAQFWEYDTRLARRWNLDPVDQIGISNYAVNELNPIVNSDRLGDRWINTHSTKEYANAVFAVDAWRENVRLAIKGGDPELIANMNSQLAKALELKNATTLKLSSDGQIIDKILTTMQVQNPELYRYWNNLQINGRDFEIRVKGQVDPNVFIDIKDPKGSRFESGESTTDVSMSKGITFVDMTLQTTSVIDSKIPEVRAENAWHGIGHSWSQMNGMEYGSHDTNGSGPGEDNAVEYSKRARGSEEGKSNNVDQVHEFNGYIKFRPR